jgi:hypothetical protein
VMMYGKMTKDQLFKECKKLESALLQSDKELVEKTKEIQGEREIRRATSKLVEAKENCLNSICQSIKAICAIKFPDTDLGYSAEEEDTEELRLLKYLYSLSR